MPIIHFEYTDNLMIDEKIKNFLIETHHILVQEIKTDLRTCRSSVIKNEHYIIGDDNPKNAYIMLTIRMLPGRTDAIKKRLGDVLLQKIHHDFSQTILEHDTQVRVYLTETDKLHYYGLD